MRPEEREAVVTTIVGGRPPGCGRDVGAIPRGIEVLVKKAAVDPDFKTMLLERRAAAAEAIGLDLSAAESAMLAAIPTDQLTCIIERTEVPEESRRAFLGTVASAMIAALGLTGCEDQPTTPPSLGNRPVTLPPRPPTVITTPAQSTNTTTTTARNDKDEELLPLPIMTPKPMFTGGHGAARTSNMDPDDPHGFKR